MKVDTMAATAKTKKVTSSETAVKIIVISKSTPTAATAAAKSTFA